MSKSQSPKSRNVGIGVAAVVLLGVGVGVGVARSRKRPSSATTTKAVLEDSVYRGFRYQIEQCSVGLFLATIPAQTVGDARLEATQGKAFSRELARSWAQATIDTKLNPVLQTVFLGASRR